MARVWTPLSLFSGAGIPLDGADTHHLQVVLRRKVGDGILMFNERDGEWNGAVDHFDKKGGLVRIGSQNRPPPPKKPAIHLLFAPLKQGPLSFLIEKAVELGVDTFMPQKTDHTAVPTLNEDRARIHIKGAAEQCGRLTLPALMPLKPLAVTLAAWDGAVPLFVCDERRLGPPVFQALSHGPTGQDLFFLIGPEGGFSKAEFMAMDIKPFVHFITLGPHILRAETAALAAIASACQTIHYKG